MRKTTVKDGKKLCLRCNKEKEVENNFFLIQSRANSKKYYKSPCKECLSEKRKLYAKKYREDNGDIVREKQRNRIKERLSNGDEVLKRNLKNSRLKHLYGITLEEHETMRENQLYSCKICKVNEKELSKGLYIDHCHSTNKVRGLVCTQCNSMLGMAKDDITVLKEAVKYLENYV